MPDGNLHLPPPVGVCTLVRESHFVLLGQRKGSHAAGLWAAPGGKPNPGEPPNRTAKRELLEETGLKALRIRPLAGWVYNRFPKDRIHYVTLFFEATIKIGEQPKLLEPDKCYGWKWFDLYDDFPDPLWPGLEMILNSMPVR